MVDASVNRASVADERIVDICFAANILRRIHVGIGEDPVLSGEYVDTVNIVHQIHLAGGILRLKTADPDGDTAQRFLPPIYLMEEVVGGRFDVVGGLDVMV